MAKSNTSGKAAAAPVVPQPENPDKKYLLALALSYFLGSLGGDRYYLGYIVSGVIKMLTLGGLGIWTLIDLLLIAFGKLRSKGNPAPLEGFAANAKPFKIIAVVLVVVHTLVVTAYIALLVYVTLTGMTQAHDKKLYDRAANVGNTLNSYIMTNATIPDDLDEVMPGEEFSGIAYTRDSDKAYTFCVDYKAAGTIQLEDNANPEPTKNLLTLTAKHTKGKNCQTIKPLDGVVGQNVRNQFTPEPTEAARNGCGASRDLASATGSYSVWSTDTKGGVTIHFSARNGGSSYVISPSTTKVYDRNCVLRDKSYLQSGDRITAFGPRPSGDIYNPTIQASVVVDFADQ